MTLSLGAGTVPATMDRPAHPRLQDFKCQEISNVMYAFAGLGSYNADVLQVTSTAAKRC